MLKYSRITVWNNHFGCILREYKMKQLHSNLDRIESDINLKKTPHKIPEISDKFVETI